MPPTSLRRIAYVVGMFPKLSETFIAHELAELRRRGIELRVLSLNRPTETIRHPFIAEHGLEELTCYEPGEFCNVLNDFRPQLLHAHFATQPTAAAREWAAQFGLPFTFTAHGYDIRRKPPPDFADRVAAARAVITVSEANRRHMIANLGANPDRLQVIPCGVNTARFCPPTKRGVFSTDLPRIVCVARHAAVKNLGLLLETCALLRDRGVPFRCVSVGEGPCRGELELRRAELRLEDHVEFVGAQDHDQVLAWWQQAEVAVLTSTNEGMPVCLMEAAACGIPTVATAVGGIPELIEHGVTGLLAPPDDAAALASAIQQLIEDRSRAAVIGAAARQRAEQLFSLEHQVDRLLDLWSSFVT